MESKQQKLVPSQAFAHPLWWIALATLVLNDHLLKGSGLSGALTGKLSDFAGLLVAPVLLAALMRVKTRQGLWSAGGATAVVFSAINLSWDFAQAWDHAVSYIVPFHTTPDPTDLIALVAIPFGLWLFLPLMTSNNQLAIQAKLLAATLGGLACMATSPEHTCFDCVEPWQEQFSSRISVLNQSNELHVVRIRPMLQEISFDCDAVAENPTAFLLDSYFGPATRWLVQSGQEIPVIIDWEEQNNAPCNAAKIESDTLPNILALWDSSAQVKTFIFDAEIPQSIPPNMNTLVIEAEYTGEELHKYLERSTCGSILDFCDESEYAELATIPSGARYSWKAVSETQMVWRLPILDSPSTRPGKACDLPGPGEGVYWGEPNGFTHVIANTIISDDGCAEIQFGSGEIWYVCGPRFALEQLVPDPAPLRIEITTLNQATSGFRGGLEALRVDVLSETNSIERSVILSRGFSIPAGAGLTFEGTWDPDCRPVEDICGSLVLPADITLSGLDAPFGEIVEFPNGKGSAMVVRAFNQPVQDPNCEILSSLLPELSLTEDPIFVELAVVLN
jgi:hypothetical protein